MIVWSTYIEYNKNNFCCFTNKMKMYYEAFLAGTWASVGSTIGKLSGTGFASDSIILYVACLAAMITANTWGNRYYLRSLDAAANSVTPTVVSASSSFIFSGVIGKLLFGESSTLIWWCGAILIAMGLTMLAQNAGKQKKKNKEDKLL